MRFVQCGCVDRSKKEDESKHKCPAEFSTFVRPTSGAGGIARAAGKTAPVGAGGGNSRREPVKKPAQEVKKKLRELMADEDPEAVLREELAGMFGSNGDLDTTNPHWTADLDAVLHQARSRPKGDYETAKNHVTVFVNNLVADLEGFNKNKHQHALTQSFGRKLDEGLEGRVRKLLGEEEEGFFIPRDEYEYENPHVEFVDVDSDLRSEQRSDVPPGFPRKLAKMMGLDMVSTRSSKGVMGRAPTKSKSGSSAAESGSTSAAAARTRVKRVTETACETDARYAPKLILAPPFKKNILKTTMKELHPGRQGAVALFEDNTDAELQGTVFLDGVTTTKGAKDAKTGKAACAFDGSSFLVRLPNATEPAKLVSVDGVKWDCLSKSMGQVPEEWIALDIQVRGNGLFATIVWQRENFHVGLISTTLWGGHDTTVVLCDTTCERKKNSNLPTG